MSIAEMFSDFLSNLAIQNRETISLRYGELTAVLNKYFRDTESKTANSLQVGSFGRGTGINGISDLDMLYIMPKSAWMAYQDGGQYKLLKHVRDAIRARYPRTNVRVDRLVVCVTYMDFHVEVQPVFEQDDGSFRYPDTKGSGSWKITKPRDEMEEISKLDTEKNKNLKRLCKMTRAWRNKHGLEMGGLLIDTLVYNFLAGTREYDTKSYLYFDWLSRDFFDFLGQLKDQDYYAAPGSRQRVKVYRKFQAKARKAYQLCIDAIEAQDTKEVNEKWRKIYGRVFPAATEKLAELPRADAVYTWRDTEEFIEDIYPTDIRFTLTIDCEVMQDGFMPHSLRVMLARHMPLMANKTLRFRIICNTVPAPFALKWKVLNRGEVAQRRDCVRGQIVADIGRAEKKEETTFRGDHVVECYAIKDGIVVAKDRIHVPIQT
jgi:hypothetical protein